MAGSKHGRAGPSASRNPDAAAAPRPLASGPASERASGSCHGVTPPYRIRRSARPRRRVEALDVLHGGPRRSPAQPALELVERSRAALRVGLDAAVVRLRTHPRPSARASSRMCQRNPTPEPPVDQPAPRVAAQASPRAGPGAAARGKPE